jgi:hypothetical protein
MSEDVAEGPALLFGETEIVEHGRLEPVEVELAMT